MRNVESAGAAIGLAEDCKHDARADVPPVVSDLPDVLDRKGEPEMDP